MNFRSVLKTLNLKVTPKRLAILDILADETGYSGPEEVRQRTKTCFAAKTIST